MFKVYIVYKDIYHAIIFITVYIKRNSIILT